MTDATPAETAPAAPDAAPEWPLRPWLLAGLLGLAGLLIHFVTTDAYDTPWRMAVAAFLAFGSVAAAFTVDRERWKEPVVFALLVGLVMAGLAWRATAVGDRYDDEEYGFAAGVVATALALPLFQAGFHRLRFRTPYGEFHDHVWTDGISAGGSLAFTGLSWIALVIVSELFHLLQLDFLRDLMNEEWFGWTFSGLAFGAALGTIRNELKLLGTLRTIVVLVLSLLAVPFAVALLIFLVSMIVSGPQVLWEATRSATPILLACAAASFALANTILRKDDAEMPKARAMRIAALALALLILPLTAFAAISMGTRIGEYGLSPERIWGLIAIVVATAYGIAFFVAVIRGRRGDWRDRVRMTNLYLGAGVCVLALILSLPILDFGAISARNQVGRLESGKVTAEQFDFTALRWDFGDAGRRELQRLAKSGNADVVELAQAALAQTERAYATFDETNKTRADFKLRVQPDDGEVRERVLDYLVANPYQCSDRCVALDLGEAVGGGRRIALVQSNGYEELLLKPGAPLERAPIVAEEPQVLGADSVVEVSEARVIRIDGRTVGLPISETTAPLEAEAPPR